MLTMSPLLFKLQTGALYLSILLTISVLQKLTFDIVVLTSTNRRDQHLHRILVPSAQVCSVNDFRLEYNA